MIRNEEEFRDSDGFLRCGICGTRREMILPIGDREVRVRVRCRCQAEADEQMRAAYRRQEQLDRVSRLRSTGLQDRRLKQFRFENDNGCNPRMTLARNYLAHWPEMEKSGRGLVLFGNTGTGKSFMAGCIANALLEQGIPVLMTTLAQLIGEITAAQWEQKNRIIAGLDAYRLLILDDLGIERTSEYVLEQMYSVVDSRHRSGLPMIVTTNLTYQELQNPGSLPLQRIYDRILERCAPVLVNDSNLRSANAEETLDNIKKFCDKDPQANT